VPDNIHRESFAIRSYDADPHRVVAPVPLCRRIQEAAGAHADSFGVGVSTLQARDLTWMLSRFRLRMESYPSFGDTLTVQTWPSGIDRLFALRDFTVTDGRGNRVASALSAWLIVNLTARRPVRVQTVFDVTYPDLPRACLPTAEKLPPLESAERETEFRVRYGDVDANRHVNNVAFIEWAVESLPPEVLTERRLRELDIDFLSEAHFPESVKAGYRQEGDGVFRHALYGEDGREIGRARTAWGPAGKDGER
jgi:medium-chain acyl-[acyl-carrier-protein] hydrolase